MSRMRRWGVMATSSRDGNNNTNLEAQRRMQELENAYQMPAAKRAGVTVTNPSRIIARRSQQQGVTHEEFTALSHRVDRIELALGCLDSKIDVVLAKVDSMEQERTQQHEALDRMLDALASTDSLGDEARREQIRRLIREQLQPRTKDTAHSAGGDAANTDA